MLLLFTTFWGQVLKKSQAVIILPKVSLEEGNKRFSIS